MALVKFKTLAVVWNGIFSRWADVGNILLWHASFSFFFIKRWSSCFDSLLPPFNDICWPLIRASCYMSLGPPGHSYLVINLHASLISGLCIWLFASFIICPARSRQVRQKQHICCMVIPYHLLYPFFLETQPRSIWTERFLKKTTEGIF